MPLLDANGVVTDEWVHLMRVEKPAEGRRYIVPLEQVPELLDFVGEHHPFGVRVPNSVDPEALTAMSPQPELIVIEFPTFSDGSGFSLARKLRDAGFGGELRACGPLIADQHAFAWACGFDKIQVPDELIERQPPEQWEHAFRTVSASYQQGYRSRLDVLSARHAGQKRSDRS